MSQVTHTPWVTLLPPFRSTVSRVAFTRYANSLAKIAKGPAAVGMIEEVRDAFVEAAQSFGHLDRQLVLAAGMVVTDLAIQGWRVRLRKKNVEVQQPLEVSSDPAGEKLRVRQQELVKRDAQLSRPATQAFVRSMERPRIRGDKIVSVLSLLREGRELAASLRAVRESDSERRVGAPNLAIEPYLEFVSSPSATCEHTGLRLMDVWRYFRHTWSNQYVNVPGRSMMFLVRDRAAALHPVIGIGALSSPVMQIRERDTWIGWHPDTFLARIRSKPTLRLARWLVRVVDDSIDEIYVDDLVEDGLVTRRDLIAPSETVIMRLRRESEAQRDRHNRFVQRRDHKGPAAKGVDSQRWTMRARTHLFRSKRSLALATFLKARHALREAFGARPTERKLSALVATSQGSEVIRKIVKKAKADRVGIAVADISVCGAVQPYNAILGGKLVAMLAASPEVVIQYRHRYATAESEIASSVAGRAIVRPPNLVLLGTTSLYGVGSSQYNRVKIPCDRLGGRADDALRYEELGHSEAYGTSQYSEETVEALTHLVQQSANGQRVNSIFGEGGSPKLRKVREGLDLLGMPSDLLLRHHRRRIVYAVSLIRNLQDHLLGLDPDPAYLVPMEDGSVATKRIADWWRKRWLNPRINSDDVLNEVARHTLVRPLTHGGRVVLPRVAERRTLFSPGEED